MAGRRSKSVDKGSTAEISLAEYFRSIGFFVARGLPVIFKSFDVTDIDLWLYNRTSPLRRERINVDCKNKKTPQAMERIFWTIGVREAFGFDQCIVATTDRRPEVHALGAKVGVMVLDGSFLQRLPAPNANRIHEEEFANSFSIGELEELGSQWKRRLDASRARLIHALDFDGCNAWLKDIQFFANASMTDAQRRIPAVRLTYLTTAYFLVALDYIFAALAFEQPARRREVLEEGFRHGSEGKVRTERTLGVAANLTVAAGAMTLADANRAMSTVLEASESMHVDVLGQHFSNNRVSSRLFEQARAFEHEAYKREVGQPDDLVQELKSTLAVLVDFLGIDRRRFFA